MGGLQFWFLAAVAALGTLFASIHMPAVVPIDLLMMVLCTDAICDAIRKRPHHSIDEQPDSHLVGDVPRIHPELHSTRNTSEAK
jgi:hypothetical protein